MHKLVRWLSGHKKQLAAIILLVAVVVVYRPQRFEHFCPIREITSMTVIDSRDLPHDKFLDLTSEQQKALADVLAKQYLRLKVIQEPARATRSLKLAIILRRDNGPGQYEAYMFQVDSYGKVHFDGGAVRGSKDFVAGFPRNEGKQLYEQVTAILDAGAGKKDWKNMQQNIAQFGGLLYN